VEHVHNAEIRLLSEKELSSECHRERVAACLAEYDARNGAQILLKNDPEGKSYEVLVHELLHVLVVCSGIQEGNTHADPVWRHVPMSNLPPESPWFVPKTPSVVTAKAPVVLPPLQIQAPSP
jgi:hypothetical protein